MPNEKAIMDKKNEIDEAMNLFYYHIEKAEDGINNEQQEAHLCILDVIENMMVELYNDIAILESI